MNLLPKRNLTSADLLVIYLNDHLAGATVGQQLFRRSAAQQSDPAARDVLRRLAREVEEDRETLKALMRRLNAPVRRHRIAFGWAAEMAGRLKPNGRLLARSPLSDLLELEALRLGVEGKAALWTALAEAAETDSRISAEEMGRLEARARAQIEELESLRLRSAAVLRVGSPW